MDQFATGLVGTRSPVRRLPLRRSTTTSAVAAAPAARSPSPLASSRSRWAPTPPAAAGFRRRSTASWVQAHPRAGQHAEGCCQPAPRSTASRSSPGPSSLAREVLDVIAAFDPEDPWSRPHRSPRRRRRRGHAGRRGPRGPIDLDPRTGGLGGGPSALACAVTVRLVPVDVAPMLEAARMLYERAVRRRTAGRLRSPAGAGRSAPGPDGTASSSQPWRGGRARLHRRATAWLRWPVPLTVARPASTPSCCRRRRTTRRTPRSPPTRSVSTAGSGATRTWPTCSTCAASPSLRAAGRTGCPSESSYWPPRSPTCRCWRSRSCSPDRRIPDGRRCRGAEPLAVCGAHLSGEPLNKVLTEAGARLHQRARTAAGYRMVRIEGLCQGQVSSTTGPVLASASTLRYGTYHGSWWPGWPGRWSPRSRSGRSGSAMAGSSPASWPVRPQPVLRTSAQPEPGGPTSRSPDETATVLDPFWRPLGQPLTAT